MGNMVNAWLNGCNFYLLPLNFENSFKRKPTDKNTANMGVPPPSTSPPIPNQKNHRPPHRQRPPNCGRSSGSASVAPTPQQGFRSPAPSLMPHCPELKATRKPPLPLRKTG